MVGREEHKIALADGVGGGVFIHAGIGAHAELYAFGNGGVREEDTLAVFARGARGKQDEEGILRGQRRGMLHKLIYLFAVAHGGEAGLHDENGDIPLQLTGKVDP